MSNNSNTGSSNKSSDSIRIAVLGSAGSGKTALVVKLLSRRFIWNYDPTLESVYRHTLNETKDPSSSAEEQQKYYLEVMDSAGSLQDELKRSGYIKWADAAVLLYSITDSESFEEVKRLRESVEEIKKLGFGVAIVGNKKDLEHFRKVDTALVTKFAADNDCLFYELSVKLDMELITQLFCDLCREVNMMRTRAGIKLHRRSSASQLLRKLIQKKLSI